MPGIERFIGSHPTIVVGLNPIKETGLGLIGICRRLRYYAVNCARQKCWEMENQKPEKRRKSCLLL